MAIVGVLVAAVVLLIGIGIIGFVMYKKKQGEDTVLAVQTLKYLKSKIRSIKCCF